MNFQKHPGENKKMNTDIGDFNRDETGFPKINLATSNEIRKLLQFISNHLNL
jgi:hypothetical protein